MLDAATYRKLYEKLLVAYRLTPGRHSTASKAAGTQFRTARGMWERGITGVDPRRPIKEVIETEQKLARGERVRDEIMERAMQTEPVALEQADAVKTRASLAKLCEAAREITLGNFSIIGKELLQVNALAGRIAKELEELAKDPWVVVEKDGQDNVLKKRRYSIREMLELQGLVARSSNQLVKASFTALQMERLHLGLPTEIIGVEEMSLEDAIREIETGYAELQQAKQNGMLLIQGGKTG